jgi:hypothetical protein
MLSSSEILERVFSGKTSFIGKIIKVKYDKRINLPIDFSFQNEHYEVLEVISSRKRLLFNFYLLRTDKGVFGLTSYNFYVPYIKINFIILWTLNFKVIE